MHHLAHDGTAALRDAGGFGRELVGLAGTVGVLLHRAGKLFRGRRGLLQRTGLLLGAGRQVQRPGGHLGRSAGNGIGALLDVAHDARQIGAHTLHVLQHGANFVLAFVADGVGQVTAGNLLGGGVCGIEALLEAVEQHQRQQH